MLPNKKLTVSDLRNVVRRYGLFLAVPVVVCTLAALILSSRLPDVYSSEMLVQVVPQRVPDAYVRSTVTLRTEDRIEALEQQVKSRTQLERMIEAFDLYPEERRRLPMQDVVEILRDTIHLELVRPARNQPIDSFYLRFTYSDPVIAARVTERVGALFVDENAADRGALAKAANDFLDAQLADARARLEAQDLKLKAFREQNAGRLPTQLEFNLQAIQSAQLQLQSVVESAASDRDRKLMLERLYNDAKLEPVAAPLAPAQPAGAADGSATAALPPRQQLEIAKAALDRLKLRLKPNHPDVRRMAKAVADLQARVAAEPPQVAEAAPASAVVSPDELQRRERLQQMRAEIESLERKSTFSDSEERRLRGVIAEHQRRIEAVPGVESEWTALTRDYDSLQANFNDLLRKSEAARVAADLEQRQIGEQFRVVDPPRVPTRPISPIRILYSAGGLVAGLLIGLGVIAFLFIRDTTFRTGEDVVQSLGLPVLAVVAAMATREDRIRQRIWRAVGVVALAGGIAAAAGVVWVMKLWKYVA
jgi:polysaccharide chain length determinant protein (PEP-CTERM system associated)